MKKLHQCIEEYRDVDLSENSRMSLADSTRPRHTIVQMKRELAQL